MVDIKRSDFVWDPLKEALNIKKHGVDFGTASEAFRDPARRILEDIEHGDREERFFCIAIVRGRVLTVRFAYQNGKIRIFGAGYWRKGRKQYEKEKKL